MEKAITSAGWAETFRTPIQASENKQQINHKESILCMGSCFAEHIGERLNAHKFKTLCNPNGILFNPISMSDSLTLLLQQETQNKMESPFFHNGMWQSYQFHGNFSHPDRKACIQGMQEAITKGYEFIQETDWLILTLGSSVVYRLKESGRVVANCHKMPPTLFEKEALTFEKMKEPLAEALRCIKLLRPTLHCIVTVSPVRYIRNSFEENSYSKANLRILAYHLCERFDWVFYFPAFEIMMDDLRDYRFYATDRIHPSTEAVDYIWHCFSETYFNEETQRMNEEIVQLRKAMQHRPLFPQSDAFLQFCQQTARQLDALQSRYPYMDWHEERAMLEKQGNTK